MKQIDCIDTTVFKQDAEVIAQLLADYRSTHCTYFNTLVKDIRACFFHYMSFRDLAEAYNYMIVTGTSPYPELPFKVCFRAVKKEIDDRRSNWYWETDYSQPLPESMYIDIHSYDGRPILYHIEYTELLTKQQHAFTGLYAEYEALKERIDIIDCSAWPKTPAGRLFTDFMCHNIHHQRAQICLTYEVLCHIPFERMTQYQWELYVKLNRVFSFPVDEQEGILCYIADWEEEYA